MSRIIQLHDNTRDKFLKAYFSTIFLKQVQMQLTRLQLIFKILFRKINGIVNPERNFKNPSS